MHPASSILVFTTASGAGYGLLCLLGLAGALQLVPPVRWLGFVEDAGLIYDAAAIERALADEAARAEWGRAARRRYEASFRVERKHLDPGATDVDGQRPDLTHLAPLHPGDVIVRQPTAA